MILMSQAYILRRMWGIKTNNKSYLKCLSKSWTSHLFIKNHLKIFLREQGIISYLEFSFREKNWEKWLKHFNRYNLPANVWYGVAPQQWRFEVSKHWQKKSRIFGTKENKDSNIYQQEKVFSISTANSSFERIEKRNKLFKNHFLTHSYLDLNKNSITNKFSKLNKKSIYNNIITNRICKSTFISNKKKIFPDLISKENIFFRYNILLWFIPEFVEQKNIYQYKKILNLDNFVIRNKNWAILRNKDLLRERELNQSIRQWRWKSKNSEKRFRKLGDMASLMTFMQNQETTISISGKVGEDLNSFYLFFRRNNSFNRLTINSEHRLPRLLDDQILIYKLISTSLNFKQRLKKMLNLENLDEYLSDTNIYKNKKKKLFLLNSFNLEDMLLPKRRREFRILNSFSLQRERNIKSSPNLLKKIREQNREIGMNKNKIIKRFIWSSYRFEDLACMNRFWFNTMNGSRFSMLRFCIYPRI